MEFLISLVTKENAIILDPFSGSGTTCIAAKKYKQTLYWYRNRPT